MGTPVIFLTFPTSFVNFRFPDIILRYWYNENIINQKQKQKQKHNILKEEG